MTPDDRLRTRSKLRPRPEASPEGATAGAPGAEKLGFLLNECAAAIRLETARALERLAIAPREAGMLICLLHRAPLVQQELSERANVDRTTTMQVVARFIADGLVERVPHPEDGRAWVLSLTARGRQVATTVERIVDGVEDRFVGAMADRERARLARTLGALLRAHRDRLGATS